MDRPDGREGGGGRLPPRQVVLHDVPAAVRLEVRIDRQMQLKRINADKPHLWKADIAASVDQFNQWFMQFAPQAFRSTRMKTTEHVKAALIATRDLRTLDAATLRANPSALPTLRMCTAPP